MILCEQMLDCIKSVFFLLKLNLVLCLFYHSDELKIIYAQIGHKLFNWLELNITLSRLWSDAVPLHHDGFIVGDFIEFKQTKNKKEAAKYE